MIDRCDGYVLKNIFFQNNICYDGLKLPNNFYLIFIYNSYTPLRTYSVCGTKKKVKCSQPVL